METLPDTFELGSDRKKIKISGLEFFIIFITAEQFDKKNLWRGLLNIDFHNENKSSEINLFICE